jgi:hypothetical protein
VHQSIILPKFEPGTDIGHVHSARGRDCLSIVLMIDMLGQVDVVAVIDKVQVVKGHRTMMLVQAIALIDADQPGLPSRTEG